MRNRHCSNVPPVQMYPLSPTVMNPFILECILSIVCVFAFSVQPAGSGQSNDSSDDSTDDSDGDSVLIIDRHIPEEIELSAQDQKIMRDAVRLSVMDEVSRVDKLQDCLLYTSRCV